MCLLFLLIALFGRHVQSATAPRTLRRRNNPVVRHRAKPPWAKAELILLKARMPTAGCRALADLFNRRHAPDMTVSKSYVADVMKRHAREIRIERRRMRRQRPGASPRNRVWALDLTGKTDQHGRLHMILGIIDHGSRFALELARIADKRALTVLGHLVRCVLRHGRPRFLRTDNEAILTSFVFRIGLALLGIRHQRTEPHCPWQNGRIERLFGTLKAPWFPCHGAVTISCWTVGRDIAVDAEHRSISHHVVHAQADEPAKQQVVVELLNELALAANGEKDLQEQCAQQLLGRNRRAASMRLAFVEQRTHVREDAVDQRTQGAQRMVLRDTLLKAHVAEHRRLGILLAAHGKSGNVGRRFEVEVCLKTRVRKQEQGFSPAC